MATTPMPLTGTSYWPQITVAATGGSVTNVQVWGSWNQGYTPTQTQTVAIGNDTVWVAWNQLNNYQPPQVISTHELSSIPELSQEQRKKMAEQEEKRIREREQARDRAEALLLSTLNRTQREQYEKEKAFELEVNDRLYRVRPGHRVERLNKSTKKIESYFCIHPCPSHNLPAADVGLAQKLFLEADEKEFLRIANETRAA